MISVMAAGLDAILTPHCLALKQVWQSWAFSGAVSEVDLCWRQILTEPDDEGIHAKPGIRWSFELGPGTA